ncbi:hypothetical protein CPT_Magia_059 [Burkholderia phage Magia]|uniref:Uncharacterized protein n=1 Tax=Burkholderia phage Magia TaxID=2767577 RepID=A0A873WBX0_9CAUD|nr:hypothetical protein PQC04_gp59 [Burkholderia phage Magia]QPB08740.1 hypothetical protein CPT_Magia_059 [Burkholderia phage Magia]
MCGPGLPSIVRERSALGRWRGVGVALMEIITKVIGVSTTKVIVWAGNL